MNPTVSQNQSTSVSTANPTAIANAEAQLKQMLSSTSFSDAEIIHLPQYDLPAWYGFMINSANYQAKLPLIYLVNQHQIISLNNPDNLPSLFQSLNVGNNPNAIGLEQFIQIYKLAYIGSPISVLYTVDPNLTQPSDFAERDFVAPNVQSTPLGTQYQFWAWIETSGVHYFAITVATDGTLITESSLSR
ncbi:hypothetical protein ACP8Y2_13635 [Herpetosiphon llansteffanensis]